MLALVTISRWPYMDISTMVRYCSCRMISLLLALSTCIFV